MNPKELFSKNPIHPLTVTNSIDLSAQFYSLNSPFNIILEVFREGDSLCNVFQFSQNGYNSTLFESNIIEFMKDRPMHRHSFIEIMFVLSGAVTNHTENQTFTYTAGQCCIMNKNIRHCEDLSGEFQIIFFMLRDDFAFELLKEYQEMSPASPNKQNPIFLLIEDAQKNMTEFKQQYLDCFPMVSAEIIQDQLSPLFNFMVHETLHWQSGSSFFIKGAFARLLHLMGDTNLFSVKRVHSNSTNQEFLFNKITHIMKTSHGRCTREELSAKLHYNSEYLNRVVKKYAGKTLREYGQSIYLEEAREMLLNTDKSISAIIKELGLANHNYFYRIFKEQYGKTPLDYRMSQ